MVDVFKYDYKFHDQSIKRAGQYCSQCSCDLHLVCFCLSHFCWIFLTNFWVFPFNFYVILLDHLICNCIFGGISFFLKNSIIFSFLALYIWCFLLTCLLIWSTQFQLIHCSLLFLGLYLPGTSSCEVCWMINEALGRFILIRILVLHVVNSQFFQTTK